MALGWRLFAAAGAVLFAAACGSETTMSTGEISVFTGPRFWTGDPARPWTDALVVSEGKIVKLADRTEIPKLIAGGGVIRQLPGKLAVPGLTDSHGHLLGYALDLHRADLRKTANIEETLARVERFARDHPDDPWILGRGWSQTRWPGKAWPDADRLEQVVRGRPCALWRVDGHALWVNRTTLAIAGIGPQTPDPAGGSIRRDAAGRPTGILIDEAMELVRGHIPGPKPQQMRAVLAEAAERLLAFGLTGVHDMGVERPQWLAMQALAQDGRFPLRVTAYAAADSDFQKEVMQSGPRTAGRLRIVGVKLYADGALGSRGARLFEPYRDDPKSVGLWVTEPGALARQVAEILAHGLQPAIHAIGDAANRAAIDAIGEAERDNATFKDLRPRIEHAQVLSPDDIPRFATYGIVSSMQPTHATSDMAWIEDRLGKDRLAGAFAWRDFLDAGAHLAFGSDFPVESPDPRGGLYAAVTRQDEDGEPAAGWFPRQRLTLAEALAAFTSGAAYAAREEQELGQLTPGRWCDVTVFEQDFFTAPPKGILEARVVTTVIGGQVVWPTQQRRPNPGRR